MAGLLVGREQREEGQFGFDGAMVPSIPASLAGNAEGGPVCRVVILWQWGGAESGSVHSARPHWLVGRSQCRDRPS